MSEPLPAPVVHDADHDRFVVNAGGTVAELVYRRDGGRLELVHTGVPSALEGHGVGGRLVRAAVGWAAAEGWSVVPSCPFARRWLREHPDVASEVVIDWNRPERVR